MENSETDCREVLAQLFAYIDGELRRPTIAGIEAHLQRCIPCHLRADFERDFKLFVGNACRESPAPEELIHRIRARLDEL